MKPDSVTNLTEAAASVFQAGRRARWELMHRTPLAFPTHHPQGLAFARDRIFLSSVEVPADENSGIGHVFVLDAQGTLVRDITLGHGEVYHPGGLDFDGASLWVPVAEYRPSSTSIVFTIDPVTLSVEERFRVADHVGWVVSDPESGVVHGGSWGSRRLSTWSQQGAELDSWENPSSFVDYQDAQYLGGGRVLCSGIAELPSQRGSARFELGGIAMIDFPGHRIVNEMPVALFSEGGHVVTRNPFALSVDSGDLMMHVAPDDGTEAGGTGAGGTELLTYRAAS